jgi:hypothetical protein
MASLVIGAAASYSLVLGSALHLRPMETMAVLGWDCRGPVFFVEQSGLFLVILGVDYAAGILNQAFAWFLVGSKAAAVFLNGEYLMGKAPPAVLLAAAPDGLMGLPVALAVLRETPNRGRRGARKVSRGYRQ